MVLLELPGPAGADDAPPLIDRSVVRRTGMAQYASHEQLPQLWACRILVPFPIATMTKLGEDDDDGVRPPPAEAEKAWQD
jgi:hypothetical protein